MLPSFEFIWKVFVSLFAIAGGILALYWVCGSALYLIVVAVDLEVTWAKKQGRRARTDAIAKASLGLLVLICLGAVFWIRR
jgi:hypothetical protein